MVIIVCTIAFGGDNCLGNVLDFFLIIKEIKEEIEEIKFSKIIYLIAHNGSGFDTSIIFYILPFDKRIVNIVKNGKGILELKILNGNIQHIKRQIPQYLHF